MTVKTIPNTLLPLPGTKLCIGVVAGAFKSFKIEVKQTNLAGQFASGKVYLWYSPEVKFVVKLEYEKVAYWRNQKNFELISFKLQ